MPSEPRSSAWLAMFSLLLPTLSGCLAPSWSGVPDLTTAIRLKVQDREGRTVPHAIVWHTKSPCSVPEAKTRPCLGVEDMRRIAHQFRESFEYFTGYTSNMPPPYRQILYLGGSDARGEWYERETLPMWGIYPPVDRVEVVLTVFKQGYLPQVTQVELRGSSVLAHTRTVVLEPDPEFPRQESALRRRFEALLQQTHAVQLNKPGLAPEERRPLPELKRELESVAKQAEAAGDKALAARAWYRLAYYPGPILDPRDPSKEIGYQSGGEGPQKAVLVKRSRALDPDNPAHLIDMVLNKELPDRDPVRGSWADIAPEVLKKFLQVDLAKLRPMMQRLWPTQLNRLYGGFLYGGDIEGGCQWLLEIERAHPKFDGLPMSKRLVGDYARKRSLPVPSGCREPSS